MKSVNKKGYSEKSGENIHIEPDFWCDYGYCISAGENFYAKSTDWSCLMQAEFLSEIMCSLLRIADSIHRDTRLILREEIRDWSMHIRLKSEITYGLAQVYR